LLCGKKRKRINTRQSGAMNSIMDKNDPGRSESNTKEKTLEEYLFREEEQNRG